MINCFVHSQTTHKLWSKLFLCRHLSLRISSEWTFSSIAAYFSTSVSLSAFWRGGRIVYVSMNQTWAHHGFIALKRTRDTTWCVQKRDTVYSMVGQTWRKREFLQSKWRKSMHGRVSLAQRREKKWRGREEKKTDDTAIWWEVLIHQMKRHDNIRAQRYYCKHVPYALTVSTSVSFFSPLCLSRPISSDFLYFSFFSLLVCLPPSLLPACCFIEECSTEESIWSYCCFDLKMEGGREGERRGLRLHVSPITLLRWQRNSLLHSATGGRERDA